VVDADFEGLNTKAGDLTTIKFKLPDQGVLSDALYIVLHPGQSLEVRDVGCQTFD
jgi:hypothetical protein